MQPNPQVVRCLWTTLHTTKAPMTYWTVGIPHDVEGGLAVLGTIRP